jgi:hypothetical protein
LRIWWLQNGVLLVQLEQLEVEEGEGYL